MYVHRYTRDLAEGRRDIVNINQHTAPSGIADPG